MPLEPPRGGPTMATTVAIGLPTILLQPHHDADLQARPCSFWVGECDSFQLRIYALGGAIFGLAERWKELEAEEKIEGQEGGASFLCLGTNMHSLVFT